MKVYYCIYLITVVGRIVAEGSVTSLKAVILSLLAEVVQELITIRNFNIKPLAYRRSVLTVANIMPLNFSVK